MAEARASCAIVIERPVTDVFAYVTDYRNNPAWQEGLQSVEQPDVPLAVGSRITTTRTVLGRRSTSVVRVTVLEPDRRIRSLSESGPVTYEGGYDFEPSGQTATRLTYRGVITTGRLMGPAGKLMAKGFQRQMDGNLGRLKAVLERGGSAATS